MARKRYDRAELQNGSKALAYSIEMLQECTRLLLPKEDKFKKVSVGYMILEAFLLHARELLEFIYPSKYAQNEPANVLAMDFFDSPDIWTPREITPILDETQSRLNKLLAHLSYSRETLNREWNCAGIYGDLQIVLNEFMAKVNRNKLIPKFNELFPMVDGNLLPSAATSAD